MADCCLITLIAIFAVFTIIALSTYLTGCHEGIQTNCLRFYLTDATVQGHSTTSKTCSVCINWTTICTGGYGRYSSRSCHSSCIQYRYYTCYDSYARFYFSLEEDPTTRSCSVRVSNGITPESAALENAQREYHLDNTYAMFINKNDYDCHEVGGVEATAIVGLVFIILAAIVLIVIIVYCFYKEYCKCFKCKKESHDSGRIQQSNPVNNNYQNRVNIPAAYQNDNNVIHVRKEQIDNVNFNHNFGGIKIQNKESNVMANPITNDEAKPVPDKNSIQAEDDANSSFKKYD